MADTAGGVGQGQKQTTFEWCLDWPQLARSPPPPPPTAALRQWLLTTTPPSSTPLTTLSSRGLPSAQVLRAGLSRCAERCGSSPSPLLSFAAPCYHPGHAGATWSFFHSKHSLHAVRPAVGWVFPGCRSRGDGARCRVRDIHAIVASLRGCRVGLLDVICLPCLSVPC